MLGFGYIKAPPTTYLLHYSGGKLKREGAGISFWYFRYNSVLAKLNVSSTDVPFVFIEMTADVQDATIQGDLTFRIVDPKKTASLLNFSLDARERYLSDDPDKLNERLVIFSDGIEEDFLEFNSGTIARIRVADQRAKLAVRV